MRNHKILQWARYKIILWLCWSVCFLLDIFQTVKVYAFTDINNRVQKKIIEKINRKNLHKSKWIDYEPEVYNLCIQTFCSIPECKAYGSFCCYRHFVFLSNCTSFMKLRQLKHLRIIFRCIPGTHVIRIN